MMRLLYFALTTFFCLMTASVVGARSGNFAHILLHSTRFGDESDHLPAASVAAKESPCFLPYTPYTRMSHIYSFVAYHG